ncbi:MAG: peptidase M61 [Bacteroidetes bacterium MedPE-SWsnd-G2]|nr:MAG: peptidase M61 [Bacteroidetes bacterium MedPE-SWsnd-G2]
MNKVLTLLLVGGFLVSCDSAKQKVDDSAVNNTIVTKVKLSDVSDDKVPVVINPGRFTEETVTYRLPKVVQGTYSVSSFGRFVDNFKALDYDGAPLAVSKSDDNTWVISNATQLDKITYDVNDTFDIELTIEDVPFSPAGTNIEDANYVLNLHGFIGYFDILKNNTYSLDVTAPANFVRTSALQQVNSTSSSDGTQITTSYLAQRYFEITDNPMMYGKLDVEEFMVGDIKIVLSVYSPNKVHSATSLKSSMFKMMEAQKAYLGDVNSTPRYDIYLYLSENSETAPTGFGALEHHTSTVVVLPEAMAKTELEKTMTDVVAHEFFHIVTPLSVHSEDVHYFDYNAPTFSKHLWMYEGVTEYFAQHFQVYEGLMTEEEFYNTMKGKIATSLNFDDSMSFTTMSENILDAPYAGNYINVYSKGALIGMCIDILMREESNGTRSMLSLMKELSAKYGKNKPFEDENLIEEISAMTYPSVAQFLETHVVNGTPIDYDLFFAKVGLIEKGVEVPTSYIQAGSGFIFDADQTKQQIYFNNGMKDNTFWASQNVEVNDVIKAVNGTELTMESAQMILGQMYGWQPGTEIELTLERKGETVNLKTTLTPAFTLQKGMTNDPDAAKALIDLRNSWLKG